MMLVEFKLALALITIVILLVVIVLLLVAILALNKQIASFINEKFSENGEKDVGDAKEALCNRASEMDII